MKELYRFRQFLTEGVIKEEKYSGAIIRKGTSDKAKEDTKIVRQALKDKGIKFTNRGEFGMNFKDADLAQIKKVIAGEKVGEFVVSRDVNENMYIDDEEFEMEMGRSKKDSLKKEMMMHVDQLMDGNIDMIDFMNVVEEIMLDVKIAAKDEELNKRRN